MVRLRWPFSTWIDAVAYGVLLAASVCGIAHAPLWTAVIGAITLSVLTWSADRWTRVVRKASDLDAQWRDLAGLAWSHGMNLRAVAYYLRGWFVWVVYGAHMAHNLFFAALSYMLGMAVGWLWGVP